MPAHILHSDVWPTAGHLDHSIATRHYRKCAHRVPSARLNLWSVPHCASAVLPVVHILQRTLSIWQVLAVRVLIFMGQMQSAVAV